MYVDGLVAAVPSVNRQKFIEHASQFADFCKEHGANRVYECWSEDIPKGKVTDFIKAVQAKENESVVS